MVKLVDTLVSEANGGNPVEVQVFSAPPPRLSEWREARDLHEIQLKVKGVGSFAEALRAVRELNRRAKLEPFVFEARLHHKKTQRKRRTTHVPVFETHP